MTECPVELKKMSDWVREEDSEGECRECILGPVTQWYRDELQDRGHTKLAEELIATVDSDDPITICEKFDQIKEDVEVAVRERLLDFDCAAQSFNLTEAPEGPE